MSRSLAFALCVLCVVSQEDESFANSETEDTTCTYVGEWEEWTECSEPCGTGTQSRNRETKGQDCPYDHTIRTCNDQACAEVTPQQTAVEHKEDEEALNQEMKLQQSELEKDATEEDQQMEDMKPGDLDAIQKMEDELEERQQALEQMGQEAEEEKAVEYTADNCVPPKCVLHMRNLPAPGVNEEGNEDASGPEGLDEQEEQQSTSSMERTLANGNSAYQNPYPAANVAPANGGGGGGSFFFIAAGLFGLGGVYFYTQQQPSQVGYATIDQTPGAGDAANEPSL
jgi:hypothetical protein